MKPRQCRLCCLIVMPSTLGHPLSYLLIQLETMSLSIGIMTSAPFINGFQITASLNGCMSIIPNMVMINIRL